MPAAVASRARAAAKSAKPSRDALPPSKKAKLSQSNGLKALANGTPERKPTVAAKMNGTKNNRKDKVAESNAAIQGGQGGHADVDMADAAEQEIIEIGSSAEESDFSDEDEAANQVEASGDAADEDNIAEDGTAEPEDMSFGERIKAQELEATPREARVVDVDSEFAGANGTSRELATTSANRSLTAPSATSLGSVLTQALRTNDQELLDSCLRVNDVDTIYATVERLPSPLVGTLLQKLAERLHKRPGRPGMLMVWVQWSLSAHGGYLATQSQLVKQLAGLNKVLKERASGLQPLLSLKGRLDMLQTQLELRRRNQERAAKDDLDEAVIYVEGEEDASSDEDDLEDGLETETPRKRSRQDLEDDDSSDDEMPLTMEVDEQSEEGSEDEEDLIDDEAEETDDDEGEDASDAASEKLDGDSESEDDTKPTPARRSTAARSGLSRRMK